MPMVRNDVWKQTLNTSIKIIEQQIAAACDDVARQRDVKVLRLLQRKRAAIGD